MFCRLYRYACKRYRRSGLTFSASAHLRAQKGRPFFRDFIDAVARVFGDHEHCATSFQRESRINQEQ
jgi:hypothetical protein